MIICAMKLLGSSLNGCAASPSWQINFANHHNRRAQIMAQTCCHTSKEDPYLAHHPIFDQSLFRQTVWNALETFLVLEIRLKIVVILPHILKKISQLFIVSPYLAVKSYRTYYPKANYILNYSVSNLSLQPTSKTSNLTYIAV